MELFTTILILISTVSFSGIVSRFIPFSLPTPLIQILLGILLACIGVKMEMEPELFLILFIPPLLFEDGRKTAITNFFYHIREIIGLALFLVFITIFGLGYLLHWILPTISLPACFALAAVLSPTDAVALSGIIGHGKIPSTEQNILEGESLMNDASGLVSFKFALLVATGAIEFDLFDASVQFLVVAVGGLLVGIVITWIYCKILRRINEWNDNEPMTQIALLCLLPFVVYIIAEHVGFSGILASVSAGMSISYSKIMKKMTISTQLQSDNTWSMLTFLFNGLVFLILGLQVPDILIDTIKEVQHDVTIELWQLSIITVILYLCLMLVRFSWLFAVKLFTKIVKLKRPIVFNKYSTKDMLISTFAGVRGAITLAAVLSIPASIQGRYELVYIAMGVILLSILTAVIILPFLLDKDKNSVDKTILHEEEAHAKEIMTENALETLRKVEMNLMQQAGESIEEKNTISLAYNSIVNEIQARNSAHLSNEVEKMQSRLYLISIGAKRATIYQLQAEGKLHDESANKLLHELNIIESLISSK